MGHGEAKELICMTHGHEKHIFHTKFRFPLKFFFQNSHYLKKKIRGDIEIRGGLFLKCKEKIVNSCHRFSNFLEI